MSILSVFKLPDIHQGVKEFRDMPAAVLLDVRSRPEYEEGHIPGSVNLPLSEIIRAESIISDKETPIFVYCYSGARSRQASHALQHMGYSRVKNIGGISGYRGEVVR